MSFNEGIILGQKIIQVLNTYSYFNIMLSFKSFFVSLQLLSTYDIIMTFVRLSFWLATAVVRSRQLHIYPNGKKVLVLAAPKDIREDGISELLQKE